MHMIFFLCVCEYHYIFTPKNYSISAIPFFESIELFNFQISYMNFS
jgi:hypothetical protein